MTLSIFKFERRAPAAEPANDGPQAPAEIDRSGFGIAVADYIEPEGFEGPRKMVLDLERLTPETLDAFFPSESTLAK